MTQLRIKECALPLLLRFTLSDELIKTNEHSFPLASDYLHPNDNDESVNIGFKDSYADMLMLRAGYESLFCGMMKNASRADSDYNRCEIGSDDSMKLQKINAVMPRKLASISKNNSKIEKVRVSWYSSLFCVTSVIHIIPWNILSVFLNAQDISTF